MHDLDMQKMKEKAAKVRQRPHLTQLIPHNSSCSDVRWRRGHCDAPSEGDGSILRC